jgi:hypothetical protein
VRAGARPRRVGKAQAFRLFADPFGGAIGRANLDVGSHTFTVTATDRAGNKSSVTHTYTL